MAETQRRNFSPVAVAGLTKEAQEAVNEAMKAMSTWRNEIADSSRKNGNRVLEKMAAAAAALGWPEQILDAARDQMQSIAGMQIKTMDRMMDAWEEQLKLPNPLTAETSVILSMMKSVPGFGPAGSWPGGEGFQQAGVNPLQLWMQFAQQWQKSWADAMTIWSKAGKPY